MRISLFKALLVVIFCFSFALWTDARSMEIVTDEERPSSRAIGRNPGCCQSDDHSCTHLGLKHWIYGIKEYVIDRCLLCTKYGFNPIDEDRAYKDEIHGVTTDCPCVACSPYGAGCLHNNPITGTICFPLATVMHLMCLPFVCCSPNNSNCLKAECWGNPSSEEKGKEEKKKIYGEPIESRYKSEKTKLKQSIKHIEVANQGDQEIAGRSDDECCTHWGLKRWVYGIKEYVVDSLLCSRGRGFCSDCCSYEFERVDEDRAYISYGLFGTWSNADSSDCWLVAYCTGLSTLIPVAPLFCPLTTITHLLCLPYSCCFPNKPLDHFEEYKRKKEEHKAIMRKLLESQSALENTRIEVSILHPEIYRDSMRRDEEQRNQDFYETQRRNIETSRIQNQINYSHYIVSTNNYNNNDYYRYYKPTFAGY